MYFKKNRLGMISALVLSLFLLQLSPAFAATTTSANDAEVISNTIPTTMIAGKTYSASITVKNTGSTTWTNANSFRLTAVGGSDPFGRVNYYLNSSESIKPGQSKTFTMNMIAPASTGTYTTDWIMTQGSGGQFGQTLIEKVNVTVSSPTTIAPTTTAPTTTAPTTPLPSGSYNVKDYGAKGNGVADDTAAINNAINYAYSKGGGTVFIPDGTYMINVSNSSSVNLKSNIKLMLSNNATLKAKPTSSSLYAVVKAGAVKNVEIVGGRIVGDRYSHLSTSGEAGRGIQITGSNNVRVADVRISDSWGDGIYIGSNTAQNYSENVDIERVNIDNNRRSGITVISAKSLTIRDAVINKTNGTLPQCGLNFEPNYKTDFLQNILVENLKVTNCANYGLQISLGRYAYSPNIVGITIKNYTSINNRLPLKDYSQYTAPAYNLNIKVL